MLDHDEIERQGLQAITKVLLGFGGTVVLILGFFAGWRGVLVGWGTTFIFTTLKKIKPDIHKIA